MPHSDASERAASGSSDFVLHQEDEGLPPRRIRSREDLPLGMDVEGRRLFLMEGAEALKLRPVCGVKRSAR